MSHTTAAKTIAVFIIIASVFRVGADVIVNNLNQPTEDYFGPIGSDSNTNDFLIGQEFTLPAGPNPFQLKEITLLLNAVSGGANITVSVWTAGSDNNPSNEIAVVSSQNVANAGEVNFVPTTNIFIPPGIYYVVAAPATPADSGRVGWAYATSTNWSGSGALNSLADTIPGDWENYSITNLPQQMSVQATAVPALITISQLGTNKTLAWSSDLNGYVVDGSTNLRSPAWLAITNAPLTVATTNTLTKSWTAPTQIFRLRQSLVAEDLEQPHSGWDGPIGTNNNSTDFLLAQQFTLPAGNYSLNKLTLALIPAGGSGNVTVSIWSVGPGNNPASKLAAVSSQLVPTAGNVDFVPPAPIALPSGTYYAVASPTSSADNGKIGWYYTISTAWTGFGTLSNNASTYSSVWANAPISSGPYQMSILVAPAKP
jgi:hypothetical protein